MFVFDIFTFNIFAFDIFSFDIFPFDIFPFDIFPFDIFPFDIFPFNIFPFNIFPFDIFTIQIHFYNIPKNPQMCPAHRDLPTPSPLTLGSTFHIQYRHIHITASRLFHSQQPLRPFSSIGSTFRIQYRSIQTQVSKTPTLHNQALKKKARGVCRGAAALRPLCGFPIFTKKYCVRSPTRTKHSIFQKYFFTFCYLTTRTLYMPSISLSSSNALADAALSRSIRV